MSKILAKGAVKMPIYKYDLQKEDLKWQRSM
jgi:hypothetical protein